MKKQETQTPDQRDMFTGGDFNRFLEVINVVLFHARKDQFYKEAQTWLQNNCNVVNGKYQLANAALIAEAPAMYKALKEAEHRLEMLSEASCFDKQDKKCLDNITTILNRIK